MIDVDERSPRLDLRMFDDLGEVVDRADRDAAVVEDLFPVFVTAREEHFLQPRDQALAVPVAIVVGSVARVVGELGAADQRTEGFPLLVAGHRQREIARPRSKGLVGQQGLVGGAQRRGDLAVGEIAAEHGAEQRQLAFHHRHVDRLSLPGALLDAQREHDRKSRVHAGREVGDRHAGAGAAAALFAGDADHSALGLQDEVERGAVAVRPVLAVAGNRAVDDAGIALARGFVVQAKPAQGTCAVVLEHHVAALDHAQESLLALGMLEVEHHAFLVAVQAHEVGGLPSGHRRAPGARNIAGAGRFDLEHLRAVVGEHGGAKGAGKGMAEIQDLYVFKRQQHGVSGKAGRKSGGRRF